MRMGYACMALGVPGTEIKGCILKNAADEKLLALSAHNIGALDRLIDYNIKNGIRLFRICSELIPFGDMNSTAWPEIFANRFKDIGAKVRQSGMRLSMHPGQYTVLNTPDEKVAQKAVDDLNYHAKVLALLGMDRRHKLILHIGGAYGDKKAAMRRFERRFAALDEAVRQRLVIENDDRIYNIGDVLELGQKLDIPVVFDYLHHENNPAIGRTGNEWIELCAATWKAEDGPQKIHYSQQAPGKRAGSHSQSIRISAFMDFYEKLENKDIDCMLEVKDKNLSAIKCSICVSAESGAEALEKEWARYKYAVLERSQEDYLRIREMLKDKKGCDKAAFYERIEGALQRQEDRGSAANAAQHVWGYFKDKADGREKKDFLRRLEQYQKGEVSLGAVKNLLNKMAMKYGERYLLDSYYFI